MSASACPTPHKHRHADANTARAAIRSLRRSNPGLTSPDLLPYECECGAWHVGHSQASLDQRISRALRQGRR